MPEIHCTPPLAQRSGVAAFIRQFEDLVKLRRFADFAGRFALYCPTASVFDT
jgi:hypothetical protein